MGDPTADDSTGNDSQRILAMLLMVAVLFLILVGGAGYVLAT